MAPHCGVMPHNCRGAELAHRDMVPALEPYFV
jgi:hypothetical protein